MNQNTNQPALAPAGETCTVVTDNVELPRGTDFAVTPGPVEFGQLAMIEIGELQTVGRYYRNVAGTDWIIQPGLLIQVTGKKSVRIVGPVRPSLLDA